MAQLKDTLISGSLRVTDTIFTNDLYTSGTIYGNAATATILQTPRTINGTNFDGSANITTTSWGTARNISISDSTGTNTGTAVSVNGSAAVTLKLPATIKASLTGNADTATSATHTRYITCPDTRSTNPAPGDYTATTTGVSFDFKQGSVIGLTTADYSGVMTFRPYASGQDWSGGNAHQIAFNNAGLYWRQGGSSWGTWTQLVQNTGTWGISITGNAATATDASYLRAPNAGGCYTDGYGNPVHNRATATDSFCIVNNAGSVKIGMYYETGALETSGSITANGSIMASYAKGTGNHIIARATGYTDSKNLDVKLMIGSGGSNHGVYSTGYSSDGTTFTESTKWMIYRDSAGTVIVNGDCTGNANSANYTSHLLGVNTSNVPYGYSEGNIIRAVWNVYGDSHWYFRAGTYPCRVDYANTSEAANYQNCVATNEIRYARNGNMQSAYDLWQGWSFAEGRVAVIKGWCFGNGDGGLAPIYGSKIYNAVWNDFAEYRVSDITEGGRVLVSDGKGHLVLSTERLQPSARVVSDTFGCSVGMSDNAKTPIGVAGRVLVYPYQSRENYKVGDALCAAPNGTADIMTREEIIQYPDRIIGIVDEIPDYEIWDQIHTNKKDDGEVGEQNHTNIEVKGRIWIYVR